MSRDDKRIKKWRSAGTLGELLSEGDGRAGLASGGDDTPEIHLREDEPQHLRYRIEELEHAPTDEERAEYAKDGWQEVCHYELDYVFAKECSADEPEVSQEAVLRDLDKKIEKEKGSIRETKIGLLIALVILAVCVFSMGRAALSGDTLLIALRFFGPTA